MTGIDGSTEFTINRQISAKSDLDWQFSMVFADQAAYDGTTRKMRSTSPQRVLAMVVEYGTAIYERVADLWPAVGAASAADPQVEDKIGGASPPAAEPASTPW